MDTTLHALSHQIAIAIQVVAVALVTIGSALALFSAARLLTTGGGGHPVQSVWMRHARWLVAALTFLLAADIVETAFSPTWDELGRLAAVALVRTFLSYFLDREMENAEALVSRGGQGGFQPITGGNANERSG